MVMQPLMSFEEEEDGSFMPCIMLTSIRYNLCFVRYTWDPTGSNLNRTDSILSPRFEGRSDQEAGQHRATDPRMMTNYLEKALEAQRGITVSRSLFTLCQLPSVCLYQPGMIESAVCVEKISHACTRKTKVASF